VDGIEEVITHIDTFGSGYTDGIDTESLIRARRFTEVTGKASERSSESVPTGFMPVAPSDLTTYKWITYGSRHLRE
jgi:glutamate-5-semialdehyde dehydrogenase